MDALTTVKPYSNEIHAQAQLWLKRDPKASYEAWKKCLPARGNSYACDHLVQFCAGICVPRFNKGCASVELCWLLSHDI